MKGINLFVYGSLREGFFNYNKYLTNKVIEKKEAKLNNMKLHHLPYKGYPAITFGEDVVMGEIMVLSEDHYEDAMKAMDEMEGFISENNPENEYHKVIMEVENLHTNKKEKCFVYFYNKDRDPLFDSRAIYIPHGDWKEYMIGGNLKKGLSYKLLEAQ
ncbi:gamma-glutamylcyclotransferase family protein [Bacillus testis]|uniref:gamma-glutamylcyclotransferase family protein n=1 Tax=Bacillus testis TaxID=1622072 RepID=UPI00067F246E|nr:gamma-glutamylcyclotransferase family protein [Bacillus testis]